MAQQALSVPPPVRFKLGRPLTLTGELTERICEIIREGNPALDAALSLGVGEGTFKTWMHRGRKGEEPFATFRSEVKSALGAIRNELRGDLRRAAAADPKNWKATEAVLSRLEPKPAPHQFAAALPSSPSDASFDWARFERETMERLAILEERRLMLAERKRDALALDVSVAEPSGSNAR